MDIFTITIEIILGIRTIFLLATAWKSVLMSMHRYLFPWQFKAFFYVQYCLVHTKYFDFFYPNSKKNVRDLAYFEIIIVRRTGVEYFMLQRISNK